MPVKLPPEIEINVFQSAARLNYRKNVVALSLVSRSVREWVKPILYESIKLFVNTPRKMRKAFGPNIEFPPPFLTPFVRKLFIVSIDEQSIQFLKACSGAHSVSLPSYVPNFKSPPHLTFRELLPSPPSHFDSPLFSQVTHLELLNFQTNIPFQTMPRLTHLAIHKWDTDAWYLGGERNCIGIMTDCQNIEILILVCDSRSQTTFVNTFNRPKKNTFPLDIAPRTQFYVSRGHDDEWDVSPDGISIWEKGRPLLEIFPSDDDSSDSSHSISEYW